MGRICPILNHPLKDGVLINDAAIVSFIHKRNVDFLPSELVCRSCKLDLIKLYNKKRARAKALYKSRCRDGSVSSLKSSSIESVPVNQQTSNESAARIVSVSDTSIVFTTSLSNAHSKLQENATKQVVNENSALPALKAQQPYVTLRKRTIRDFLTAQPRSPAVNPITPPSTIATRSSTNVDQPKQQARHITASFDSDEAEDSRRLSQEPTTSKAANPSKRPRTNIISDSNYDDDVRLSLNAVNGTRLPHIQPIPPTRKPAPVKEKNFVRDIMDEYIKNITGG